MPQRVLIINPYGIGDVLFSTALVDAIRAQSPETVFGALVNRRGESVMRRCPGVEDIFVYDRDDFENTRRQKGVRAYGRRWLDLIQAIRQKCYDWAFDFSMVSVFGFVAWRAGIPRRAGYDYKRRGWFLTHKRPLEGFEERHVIEYYKDLLTLGGWEPRTGRLRFPLTDEERRRADERLSSAGVELARKKIAVFPGGGASWGREASAKQWAVEGFAQLADRLMDQHDCQVVILGGEDDVSRAEAMQKTMRHQAVNWTGQTGLDETAAVLSRMDAAVMNDGGPLHLAVAVGAPTVSIFGPVDERVYGPYPREGHRVVARSLACRPCYRRFRRAMCSHQLCLKTITVDDVWLHVDGMLKVGKKSDGGGSIPVFGSDQGGE